MLRTSLSRAFDLKIRTRQNVSVTILRHVGRGQGVGLFCLCERFLESLLGAKQDAEKDRNPEHMMGIMIHVVKHNFAAPSKSGIFIENGTTG